jgi:signal transduction histidine kinase
VLHRQLLYAAGFALLAALVIGSLIADRVSRRVQRIAVAAEQIADGDFSEPLSDGFGDEIGFLAQSIDTMRERLAANFAAITSERQRLSTVLDDLDEGVLTVAPDGRIDVANRAAAELLGARPADAAELLALLEPDAPPALDARERIWRLPDGYVTLNGRALHVQVTPLAHDGTEARLVVVADRTAEQQREETERRFIANASHELRTPLSAIVAAVEVLQTGAKDDDATRDQFLDDLQHEAARLDRLTSTLLTLARLGSGEIEPVARPIDAGRSIRQAASLMQSLAAAAGVTIETEGSAAVVTDDDVLEQVLVGLIGNAIRHSPDGATVRVVASSDRGRATVEVADTGRGIPPAELPRIFDRFYQVDRSRSSGGFGLGLAICREFVTALGGTISVASKLGVGTTFTIRLPAVPAGRPVQPASSAEHV